MNIQVAVSVNQSDYAGALITNIVSIIVVMQAATFGRLKVQRNQVQIFQFL